MLAPSSIASPKADPEREIADALLQAGVSSVSVPELVKLLKPKFHALFAPQERDVMVGTTDEQTPSYADAHQPYARAPTIFETEFSSWTRERLVKGITDVLVDALGVDEDELTEGARLEADLGAESIDYLDILFRVEKEFGIEIPRGELFSINGVVFEDDAFRRVGGPSQNKIYVTEAGLAELKERLPHLNVDAFAADPDLALASDLHTVGSMVRFLEFRQQKIREMSGAESA